MHLVCVPERLCPRCLLCLSMTEHLSEASCQSAAFNQIVAAKGKCQKKDEGWTEIYCNQTDKLLI